MLKTTSILTAVGLGLSSLPVTSAPARAGGEGVAAGIIGFTAGAIVGSQLSKKRPRRVYRRSVPRRSAEEREYWMSIQAALNRAGFPAGPVDGAPGRRTRAAVRDFQLSLRQEPTGTLTTAQTDRLFALANPQPVVQQPGVPPAAYQPQAPAQAYQPQQGIPQAPQPVYQATPGYSATPGLVPQAHAAQPVQPVTYPPLPQAGGTQVPAGTAAAATPGFPAVQVPSAAGTAPAGAAGFPAPQQPLALQGPAGGAAAPAATGFPAVQAPAAAAAVPGQGAGGTSGFPTPAESAAPQPVFPAPGVGGGGEQLVTTQPDSLMPPSGGSETAAAMPAETAAPVPDAPAEAQPLVEAALPPSGAEEAPEAAVPAPDATQAAAVSPTPPAQAAPAPQARIQIDEMGQPYIMLNGQKILLETAGGGN